MPRLLDVLMSLSLLLGGSVAVPGAEADRPGRGTWPLDPRPVVSERFDPPAQEWLPGHRGVDLVGSSGQWVHSALPGRVRFAGPVAGKQVVVVEHGTTRTTYEPVLPEVSVGDVVAAGDRIGWLLPGPSHCAPATCLHWGWRDGDLYLDPLLLVGDRPPVRLLPLWSQGPAPLGPRSSRSWMGLPVGVP